VQPAAQHPNGADAPPENDGARLICCVSESGNLSALAYGQKFEK
jgi:hypothetical protein